MNARYSLRMETVDGTLEDAFLHMARKDWALAAARRAAANCACTDVVRIWVDDTKTGLGVKAFKTRFIQEVTL